MPITPEVVSPESDFDRLTARNIDNLARLLNDTESRLNRLSKLVNDHQIRLNNLPVWEKIEAASVTLNAGGSVSGVTDLRTANDGNVYHINEVAGAPGLQLIVDFEGIQEFVTVNILAGYDGSTVHAVNTELYNWSVGAWYKFGSCQHCESAAGTIFENHDFYVYAPGEYIGTGANKGNVRVRFNHPMAGNASHDLDIDVVALYKYSEKVVNGYR